LELLHPELALANVGDRFPTWEEILAIVVMDVLLIVWALYLFRRSVGRSRRGSPLKQHASHVAPASADGRMRRRQRDDVETDGGLGRAEPPQVA
jgi:hypothetical protein